jgi:hypothetical protein
MISPEKVAAVDALNESPNPKAGSSEVEAGSLLLLQLPAIAYLSRTLSVRRQLGSV